MKAKLLEENGQTVASVNASYSHFKTSLLCSRLVIIKSSKAKHHKGTKHKLLKREPSEQKINNLNVQNDQSKS